jgi:hypothetical protein
VLRVHASCLELNERRDLEVGARHILSFLLGPVQLNAQGGSLGACEAQNLELKLQLALSGSHPKLKLK